MKVSAFLAMVALSLLCIAPAAQAVVILPGGSVTYSDSVPLQNTDWTGTMSFPKFDPALGTLDSVEIKLAGHVQGSAAFENLDDSTQTITLRLQAAITLERPDGSDLVQVYPLANTSDTVGAFDLVQDFGGTSGKTYDSLSGDDDETLSFSSVADLALFTGPGTITLGVEALAASVGTGGGNLVTQFTTNACSSVDVTYHYTPEPATMALLGFGGLAVLRRRRR